MRVYLSGPITGLTYAEGQGWREDAKKLLAAEGMIGISPLRAKEYLANRGALASGYSEFPLSTPKGITTRDRWDTLRADMMIVNVIGAKVPSLGTIMEMGWADIARIPIILAMEPEGNPHDHAMVREVSGFIVHSIYDATQIAIGLGAIKNRT
jgi:nucleoside 2-deoxyribosyltransferase